MIRNTSEFVISLALRFQSIKLKTSGFEDDSKISPFSVLTKDVIFIEIDNGF